MQSLLNDVREKLEGLNVFRYIDEDWGQLDEFSPNPPVMWPTALVDIISATPSGLGRGLQNNNLILRVKIADLRISNSSQKAPASQKDAAGSTLRFASRVFGVLHGWHKTNSEYSSLERIKLQKVIRGDGIREYMIDFSTVLRESDAEQVTTDLSSSVPDIIKPDITVTK